MLSDDQGIVWTNPEGYTLRPSIWTVIGEDFLDSAFVWAHKADPNAVLILNDYGVEFKGDAKAEAFYNLAKSLKDRGVPIDGVGLQCHLDVFGVDPGKLEKNIKRYNDIGLKCVITELDLGMDSNTESNLRQQAQDYFNIAQVALKHNHCNELMIWGLTDNRSWRSNGNPLLFDAQLNEKPAYYGLHAAVRQASGTDIQGGDGIEEAIANYGEPVKQTLYSLQGVPVGNSYRGPVLKVTLYKNGKKSIRKTFDAPCDQF